MPTRIRSTGMGIALLNQGVSTAIAAVFLPTAGNYGYAGMFLFWVACTVVYFITAVFLLPKTKGKTLEEIEEYFERGRSKRQRDAPVQPTGWPCVVYRTMVGGITAVAAGAFRVGFGQRRAADDPQSRSGSAFGRDWQDIERWLRTIPTKLSLMALPGC